MPSLTGLPLTIFWHQTSSPFGGGAPLKVAPEGHASGCSTARLHEKVSATVAPIRMTAKGVARGPHFMAESESGFEKTNGDARCASPIDPWRADNRRAVHAPLFRSRRAEQVS